MWDLNCGCNPPVPQQIIFDIPDDCCKINKNKNNIIPENIRIEDNKECLKINIINEFLSILKKLECGILPDIENLLQEISLFNIKYCYV